MRLEDHFEFETTDTPLGPAETIRIKGHRTAIEHVLTYFNEGIQPDAIVRDYYPTLTLEEVYATVTHYLRNRGAVDAYLERGDRIEDALYREHLLQEPAPVVRRSRALAEERRRQGTDSEK